MRRTPSRCYGQDMEKTELVALHFMLIADGVPDQKVQFIDAACKDYAGPIKARVDLSAVFMAWQLCKLYEGTLKPHQVDWYFLMKQQIEHEKAAQQAQAPQE